MINNPFGINIIPDNDSERLLELKRYQILDTPPEAAFNGIADLAAQIFDVSMALISFVAAEKVFFKANIGMGNLREVERDKSLCALAILNTEPTIFQNASKNSKSTITEHADDIRLSFYAGTPIVTSEGFAIGTLSIIDSQSRPFSKADESILNSLAKLVMEQVEMRLINISSAISRKTILRASLRNRKN
jgi:GAF domain-containing protein